jgi:6,7-dimethyl-8-ribityllumazine synthase
VNTIDGVLDGSGLRVAIAAGRFNEAVVGRLVDGACDCLRRHRVADDDTTVAWVPGAWELPTVATALAESGQFDALVAVGAVVRGETPHFERVAARVAELGQLADRSGVAVGLGVLTTETFDQAVERAGGKAGNQGWAAAMAAIETTRVLAQLPQR